MELVLVEVDPATGIKFNWLSMICRLYLGVMLARGSGSTCSPTTSSLSSVTPTVLDDSTVAPDG